MTVGKAPPAASEPARVGLRESDRKLTASDGCATRPGWPAGVVGWLAGAMAGAASDVGDSLVSVEKPLLEELRGSRRCAALRQAMWAATVPGAGAVAGVVVLVVVACCALCWTPNALRTLAV